MATVRPSKLEADVLKDPFRSGERRVFEQCALLPATWYALYGVAWVGADRGRGATEGEADFVFIGPEIGLVVLEVKGGQVGRDDSGWFSVDRRGVRHPIKDPVQQAQRSKYEFLRMLRSVTEIAGVRVPAAHIVCFPNANAPPSLPDLPPSICICEGDLDQLQGGLETGAAFFSGDKADCRPLTDRQCRAIADALKPNFVMPGRWSTVAREHERYIDRLTNDQARILDALSANRLIGLTGPAGSGKTVIALRRIRDLVAAGRNVLVVLPTSLLIEYYKAALGETVGAFFVMTSHFDNAPLAERVTWDAIVVDEAQDVSLDGWARIEGLMDGHETSLMVIYDANQRLAKKGDFYLPEGLADVYLGRVVRNTRQIGELSCRFFRNDKRVPDFAGPDGTAIKELLVTTQEDLPAVVAEYVLHLVRVEGFDFRDIVVLLAGSGRMLRTTGAAGVSFRAAQTEWELGRKHPMVVCGTVASFRGLESQVVVLADLDELLGRDLVEACYVGMSRARHVLAIAGTAETLRRVRELQ